MRMLIVDPAGISTTLGCGGAGAAAAGAAAGGGGGGIESVCVDAGAAARFFSLRGAGGGSGFASGGGGVASAILTLMRSLTRVTPGVSDDSLNAAYRAASLGTSPLSVTSPFCEVIC